ncbi:MAG TPA: tetratricopeptide repeat protein, partial [Chthoniobacterales bacterium]|nr:tetratricopeptide repeat protein [Chthoniobacterales bacterium]
MEANPNESQSALSGFLCELRRRKVYRVAAGYAVVAWLLIQIATQTFPFLDIPNWAVRLVIVLLALGLPVALVLAWAFDITPEGLKRTEDVPPDGRPAPTTGIPEKSIAVLPFENLSDDPHNEYVADGIQDDILANLAKIADLKVISRTSVRQYKTGVRNLREIGRELGVAHILEGSVRRVGNRLRVNAQLINAGTDAHIWAETFDREVTDLFALQSELAERITLALRANLSPQEKASLKLHSTGSLEAYENFLRARDLFRWSGAGDPRENGERALRYLERAISLDPQFALAHALASRWHGELFWFGYDKSAARLEQMKQAAEAALRLQPELGDAQMALAYYHYFGFRDYERAREKLEVARRATPNDAEIYDALGAISRRQGKWEEALANFEKALELDPRNPSVIWNLAETCALLGRAEEAERTIGHGLEVNPDAHLFPLLRGTMALRARGETAPLRAELRKIPREFDPGGGVSLVAVRLALMERDAAEARRLLSSTPHERFNDNGLGGIAGMLDGYSFPRAWLEGLIAHARGEEHDARRHFEEAREDVQEDLDCCPEDPKAVMVRGLIHAALGQRPEAVSDGEEAVRMLPIKRDAYDGPVLATNLAAIYAQVGEKARALDLLESLRRVPMAATAGTLRVEPEWDGLRDETRFR